MWPTYQKLLVLSHFSWLSHSPVRDCTTMFFSHCTNANVGYFTGPYFTSTFMIKPVIGPHLYQPGQYCSFFSNPLIWPLLIRHTRHLTPWVVDPWFQHQISLRDRCTQMSHIYFWPTVLFWKTGVTCQFQVHNTETDLMTFYTSHHNFTLIDKCHLSISGE